MHGLATNVFLGLDPTAWAAVAAIGSLLAAVSAFVTALLSHALTGARPKVRVQLACLDGYTLHRNEVRAKLPPRWPANGIEAVAVTISNGGRTPLTSATPQFDLLDEWWRPRRWIRTVRRYHRSVTTTALPFQDVTTSSTVRIEPFDSATYLVDLTPLFDSPIHRRRGERWHHIRIRVSIAGRRDVLVRRSTIQANPTIPQLSGRPVTFEQFTHRVLLSGALGETLAGRTGHDRKWPTPYSAGIVAELLTLAKTRDKKLTQLNIFDALHVAATDLSTDSLVSLTFVIGRELRDHGYTTQSDLLSEPLPPRDELVPMPPSRTEGQRFGRKLMRFARRVTGGGQPQFSGRQA